MKVVTAIKWAVKQDVDINARSGVYFLRTSVESKEEDIVWKFYNTIREIEATFRVLKTDLDLRPIYHKNVSLRGPTSCIFQKSGLGAPGSKSFNLSVGQS